MKSRIKNHITAYCFVVLFLFLPGGALLEAQQMIPVFGNQELIGGFEKETDGEILAYYSSMPVFAKDALLTRCTDGMKTITWKTARVPVKLDREYYYFYWLSGHSSGTSSADRKFTLKINGEPFLTFITPAKKKPPLVWTFSGKDSVAVVFKAIKTDVHKDLFGEMYLRVPKQLLVPGQQLTLSITGDAENSNDWFMVFRYPYTEKISLSATPFLVQTENGIKQILQLYADHIYPDMNSIDMIIGTRTIKVPIFAGFNDITVPVDTVAEPRTLRIMVKAGEKAIREFSIIQRPVNRREVDIIHHSHNDIGYSHMQEEVIQIQQRNILDALDQIDRTCDYPAGSRFVWNEETLWPVEYFLKHASEKDRQRFISAVKNNRIALSSFYVGVMTGLCSPEEIRWISEYADTLKKQYGFPINTAMLSDIPGMSWSVTDALINDGTRYLSSGPNYMAELPDKGDRVGSLYRYLGDRPFYWKTTTDRDSLLVWIAGCGYSAFHQVPAPELGEKIKTKLASYLAELDSAGYPYETIQLRYTIKSDNGPVDTGLCNFVRNWNLHYVSPKLVIANVGQMMQRFEKNYGKSLPVFSGDFTPYWEDGAYSTAKEEGENRMLSDQVVQLEKLAATMPEKKVDREWFYEARKNIVMFHEHTWGAWNSISNPDDAFVVNQWKYKKSFIDSTKKYLGKIVRILLPESGHPATLTVYNTLPRVHSGFIETKLPDTVGKVNALLDENNELTRIQFLGNGNIGFIAKDVPGNGMKKYKPVNSGFLPVEPDDGYTCLVDSAGEVIKSLRYLGKEWINAAEFKGLGQVLYIKGLDPAMSISSGADKIEFSENGPVVKTIRFKTTLEGFNQLTCSISFYPGLHYVKYSWLIDKKAVRRKESLHLVFPFQIDDPVDRIGVSDTCFIPGRGQIPGSNKDFYSVQRWLDVSGAIEGVTICSPQAALFEFGSMTDERPLNRGYKQWKKDNNPSSTCFLYALNNYWNTNFKADQQGLIPFDCYLHFHYAFDLEEAKHFGEEVHFPLIATWY